MQGEQLRKWIANLGYGSVTDFVRDRTGEGADGPTGKALINLISRLSKKELFTATNWKALHQFIPELTPEVLSSQEREEDTPTLKEVLEIIERHKEETKEQFTTILNGINALSKSIKDLKPNSEL